MKSVYDVITKCCGCEGCKQICPTNCIKMVSDKKGFFYPCIDQEKCIDCGLCRKSCFYHHEIKKYDINNCYVYLNSNPKYRFESSSSGAFEIVCRAFTEDCKENEIIIFGAEINKDFKIQHAFSKGFATIGNFKKSKYVQSQIGNNFLLVKQFLKEGKRVIFSGTPCQIMGLKSFLKRDDPNLLLIDILCHGVPSQKVFTKYLHYIEKTHKTQIYQYTFRYKVQNQNKEWSNLNVKIDFKNGKSLIRNCSEDPYMESFLNGMLNRECCGTCPFASVERVSDITLGDFWGIDKVIPELSELKTNGTSLLLVNSNKGKELEPYLSNTGILKKIDITHAIPYNGQLSHPQKFNDKRELFFKELGKRNGFAKAIRKCYPERYGFLKVYEQKIYSLKIYQKLSKMKSKIINFMK